MYFPIGCIKCHNAGLNNSAALSFVGLNRTKTLIVVLSPDSVYLWKTKPRILLAIHQRTEKSIRNYGDNSFAVFKPDSSAIFVLTKTSSILLYDLLNENGEYIYHLQSPGSHYVEQLEPHGIQEYSLSMKYVITLDSDITSHSLRSEELIVATTDGWLHRLAWNGKMNSELAINIRCVRFSADLETTTGTSLGGDVLYVKGIECSSLLGGFGIVLSDGRAGFLMSTSAVARPSEIVGVFAKDINDASCIAVNHKYQLIAFGCESGKALAYTFDDLYGGLMLSHKYSLPSKDYPEQGKKAGRVTSLAWTPDGCALAMTWSKGGIAVWSVFGALLTCTLQSDFCFSPDDQNPEPLLVKSLGWGPEGYQLIMIPEVSANSNNLVEGDILQLSFAKSALAVNPCMPNRQHLFLQGESSIYVNSGDMVLPNSDVNKAPRNTLFSNRHWQTIQVPSAYISANWPIRYAAIHWSGRDMAIAGKFGYAIYTLHTRKWKLFGNETQEKNVTCRGGLILWDEYLIVGCYNIEDESDEVRIHHRKSNIDARTAQSIKFESPVFLINIFHDILLVYNADSRVSFYQLLLDEQTSPSTVRPTLVSEVSLMDHIQHPLFVTSLSLTTLKNEQSTLSTSVEGYEANSLIMNVAGKIMMLQKDRPAAEREGEKVQFLSPVVLASCVENVWYMVDAHSYKKHLSESLWLACGAQGMKAWLPLFPVKEGGRPLGFLSKRIMLHFDLHVYPLSVLFEDAVILGIGTDNVSNAFSPVFSSRSSNLFSYYSLERTTQVYLPQILRQLLRRNLGVHALEIARTCTNLPYFTHVLELMLHEVLEKEATASEPIPDPLLPRIVAFIQEFPQYLETVCHCARKTEVALWRHLFSVVGNPIDLFKECCESDKLETAASYLIIIQNLEHHSVSRQHATLLLEAALDNYKWELSKDLVRFLTAIGKGDPDSPPRTPLHKSFHPPIMTETDGNEGEVTPVLVPVHKPPSRTNSVTTTQAIKGSSSGVSSPKEKPKRPTFLKRDSSLSALSDYSVSSRPVTVESCEQFFTDLILARHARKLLSSFRLRDLGRFSAHLDFDLTSWFIKERFRAALVEDYVDALIMLHRQFEWSFPILPNGSRVSSASRDSSRFYSRSSGETPLDEENLTRLNEVKSEEDIADEIQAKLASIKAEDPETPSSGVEKSDTSSVAQSIDYELESIDGYSWVTEPPNMMEFDQKTPLGSKQCELQLRYLLTVFVEARCIDWCILLSMMLGDLAGLSQVIEKMVTFKDLTKPKLDALMQQLSSLEEWTEKNCTGYQFLISTIKASCEELYSSALEEEPKAEKKATPKEERMFFKEDESKIAQPKVDVVVEGEIKDKHAEEDEPSECVIC